MYDLYEEYLKWYGITEEMINEHINTPLRDPRDLTEIEKFTDELLKRQDKRFLIRTDYDGDGVCSGILLYVAMKELGFDCELTFPITDTGYGLTVPEVERIAEKYPDIDVILTADCGITNDEGVRLANEKGYEVFVSDHHTGQAYMHPHTAIAVVNPNRVDVEGTSSFKEISGTFVAYKIMQLLHEKHPDGNAKLLEALEPLVAISTITDVMTIKDENVYMLRKYKDYALKHVHAARKVSQLQEFQNYLNGMHVLCATLPNTLHSKTLGWDLGPMLNSPRRVANNSTAAFQVFLQTDIVKAKEALDALKEMNELRKTRTNELLNSLPRSNDKVIVLNNPNDKGLMGLVSSRVCHLLDAPVVTFVSEGGKVFGGSARAPMGYNLLDLFYYVKSKDPDVIVSCGGHAAAAGVSINGTKIFEFKQLWEEACINCPRKKIVKEIKPFMLGTRELTELSSMTLSIGLAEIDELYPFTKEIPALTVVAQIDPKNTPMLLMKGVHAKFALSPAIEVIIWNYMTSPSKDKFTVGGQLSENTFKGITKYQILSNR